MSAVATPYTQPQLGLIFRERTRLDRAFMDYHRRHPEVYALLVQMAREARSSGFESYSISTLFEVIRWHRRDLVVDERPFKLPNNHRSRYSRIIMDNEPDLRGFFTLRPLRAA